jgi:hypothetical protein
MKKSRKHLERLFEAAAAAPRELLSEAPFSLETRVLAGWRSSPDEDDLDSLLALLRRGFMCACLLLLLSVAANYQSFWEAGPNELSTTDSAIKLSLLP